MILNMDDKQNAPPTYDEAIRTNYNTAYSAPIGDLNGYQFVQHSEGLDLGQRPLQSTPPYQYQHTAAIMTQPTFATTQTTIVPDYMNTAIFATFCCFWPLGVMAILRSSEVRNALARNDITGALAKARESKQMASLSIGIGVAMWLAVVLVIIIVTFSS